MKPEAAKKTRRKNKEEHGAVGKAYLVLYACSLSRALYLELLPSFETSEFLGSFKRLIARRGRPAVICSDNEQTFIGAAEWLKQIRRDERLQAFLAHQNIRWSSTSAERRGGEAIRAPHRLGKDQFVEDCRKYDLDVERAE